MIDPTISYGSPYLRITFTVILPRRRLQSQYSRDTTLTFIEYTLGLIRLEEPDHTFVYLDNQAELGYPIRLR